MFLTSNFEPLVAADDKCWAIGTKCGQFCLVSSDPVKKGDLIFVVEGVEVTNPTFTSVQIGANVHLDVDPAFGLAEQMLAYPWRFMNHHCEANALISGRNCFAARDITAGEELAFNYNTTEYEMAQPFDCECGAKQCAGKIGGFRHASGTERSRLASLVAEHVVALT